MDFTINQSKGDLKIIDKDNLIYEDKDSVVNLYCKDFNNLTDIQKVTNIIAILNDFSTNELIVYKYILTTIIERNNNMSADNVIKFNSYTITNLASKFCISESSIRRAISTLIAKNVIRRRVNNGKFIDTEYILNKEFDTTPILYKDKVNFLTIQFIN